MTALLAVVMSGCALFRPPSDQIIYQLERELLALKLDKKNLEEQLLDCDEAGAQRGLEVYRQLIQVFADSEVTVERRGSEVKVSVPSAVVFSADQISVRQEAAMVFDLLAVALNLHTDTQVLVVGHTDDRRPPKGYPDNQTFSAAQATTFATVLIERHAVAASRLTAAGRGEADPIADNSTPEGQNQNRRISLYIGPDVGGW
ncbi:MAG: OmpA family protein [Myxococcota bacterium]